LLKAAVSANSEAASPPSRPPTTEHHHRYPASAISQPAFALVERKQTPGARRLHSPTNFCLLPSRQVALVWLAGPHAPPLTCGNTIIAHKKHCLPGSSPAYDRTALKMDIHQVRGVLVASMDQDTDRRRQAESQLKQVRGARPGTPYNQVPFSPSYLTPSHYCLDLGCLILHFVAWAVGFRACLC
jgi:hypothetical protein